MKNNKNVMLSQFSDTVAEILDTYSYNMETELKKSLKTFGTESKDYIADLSNKDIINPKNRDKYVHCFVNKKLGNGLARRIANTEYRLSHLLEDGHEVKNQYGGPYRIKKSKYAIKGTFRKKTIKHGMWKKTYGVMEKELPKVIEETVLKVK